MHRPQKCSQCQELGGGYNDACREDDRGNVPRAAPPEAQHAAEDRAFLSPTHTADVHHRQYVCRNVENESGDQPSQGVLRAPWQALVQQGCATRARLQRTGNRRGLHDQAAGSASHKSKADGTYGYDHPYACKRVHQNWGSTMLRIVSRIVRLASAQMPIPGVTCTQLDNFTIATSAPSKNTSVMLQGRERCRVTSSPRKPGARRPKRANASTQSSSAICSNGSMNMLSASTAAGHAAQPCSINKAAPQTVASVRMPPTSMVING